MRETSEASSIRVGLVLAVAGTALFAMKSIFIKLAYAKGIDTVTLLTLRMLIAMPIYAAILIWLLKHQNFGKPIPNGKPLGGILLLGFIGYYLSSFLDMEGLNHITAQLERLTLYTYPIMTTLLGWLFLKEVINRYIIAALILTYSGIMVIYAQESFAGNANTHLGVALVMMSALSYSIYVVSSKPVIQKFGSRMFTSIVMLASTGFVFVHFLLTHHIGNLLIQTDAWLYAFLLAIFSTVLPSYIMAEVISRIGASKMSIIGTLGPLFTILIAIIVLNEPFGWAHFIGLLLVVGGVSLLGKKVS
ncbi:MAG: Permease of the drug/metabolite transporter (DMT) superfamily [uncultured Thiotrichaceae bacterium]|uniref:Permease of the drug/metabolite transporter (DMT) superfamily n=1 Tax=uncultured Thiotrichaceae bacterium TaxID=298394 RepID=A0A6S6ULP0_9GAMM|nr:MAG: Permease of the drug/metabolite transporter (DMT) superfamily [uncultured Thiotrichaceae bacterium]